MTCLSIIIGRVSSRMVISTAAEYRCEEAQAGERLDVAERIYESYL